MVQMILAEGPIWRRTQSVLNLGPFSKRTLLDLLQDAGWDAGGGVQVNIDLVERDPLLGIHIAPERIQGEIAAVQTQPAEIALPEIGRTRWRPALHDELLQNDLANVTRDGHTACPGCHAALCGHAPGAGEAEAHFMDDLLGRYVEVACLQCLRDLLLVAQCLKTIQDRPPGVIGEQSRFQMRKELAQRAVTLWEAILPHLPDRLNIEATPGVEERLDDLFEKGAVLDEGLDRIIANCLHGTGKGVLQGIAPPALGGTGQPIFEVTDRIAEASLGDQPEPGFKGRTE